MRSFGVIDRKKRYIVRLVAMLASHIGTNPMTAMSSSTGCSTYSAAATPMIRATPRTRPMAAPVTPIIRPIAFIARRSRSWNSGVSNRFRSIAMMRSSRTEFVCRSTIADRSDCCWFCTRFAPLPSSESPIVATSSCPTRPTSPPLPVARTAAMRSRVMTSCAPTMTALTACGARLTMKRRGAASQTRRNDEASTRGTRRSWRRSAGGSMERVPLKKIILRG